MPSVKNLVREMWPLPALPEIALRARDLLADPDVSLSEVAEVIALDPVLAARIVRMANSPLYGGRSGTEYSLQHAVMRLGTKETNAIVLTVAVMQTVPELPPPLTVHSFWCLGLGTAVAARKIAEDLKYEDPDQAYLAGLVHCMGDALIATKRPDVFARAAAVSEESGVPLRDAIGAEFEIPVPKISAELVREWNLPPAIVEAVSYQEDPANAPEHSLLASILSAASRMCRGLGLVPEAHGTPDDSWDEDLGEEFLELIAALGYSDVSFYLLAQLQSLTEIEDLVQQAFQPDAASE